MNIPKSKFNVADKVAVRCDEYPGVPFPATVSAVWWCSKYNQHEYRVMEDDGCESDGYTDEWLSPASGSASSGVDFNINHYVHVRLTPHGRECLRKNYDELAGFYGGKLTWEFRLPDEDAEGWSKWQMHDLMDALGKYVGMGRELPFETNIRIELPRQNAQAMASADTQTPPKEKTP